MHLNLVLKDWETIKIYVKIRYLQWSQWHILLKDFGVVGKVVVRGQMDASAVAVRDPREC